MPTTRGKTVVRCTVLFGSITLLVLACSFFFFLPLAREQVNLWRLESGNSETRRAAARELGKLKSERAVPVLLNLFESEDWNVDSAFAEALVEIGEAAIPSLAARLDSTEGESARILLVRIGPTAVPCLLETLQSDDEWVRGVSVLALGEIGTTNAVPSLILLLRHESAAVRASVVSALGELRESASSACEELIHCLSDDEEIPKNWVQFAIAKAKCRAAVPVLVKQMGDQRWHVSLGAAICLTEIAPEESAAAIPVLEAALENTELEDHHHWHPTVVESLIRIGEPALPTFRRLVVRGVDARVRSRAISALAKMGPLARPAIPELRSVASDSEDALREAAKWALQQIPKE